MYLFMMSCFENVFCFQERAEFHKTGSDKKPETWTEIDKSNGNRL